MTMNSTFSTATWQSLQQAAQRAQMGAALQQAIELYTQALAFPDVPWEQYSAMVLARAESRHFQGENAAADADLSALAEQAADRGDSGIQSITLRELSLLLFYLGESRACP